MSNYSDNFFRFSHYIYIKYIQFSKVRFFKDFFNLHKAHLFWLNAIQLHSIYQGRTEFYY